VGIICLVIGIVTTMSALSYLSFYSDINSGIAGSKFLANNSHDLVRYPVSENNFGSNLDNTTSSILVALWIGLMIFGSYLLFHIHFKVLPKE
jgi:hypothetical protein